jgi:formate/nitrite transporter FocA (FNT family)
MVLISVFVILQGLIWATSPVIGLITHHKRLNHHLGFHKKIQNRPVNQIQMSFMSDTQELRPPKAMYTHVVDIGATKALISPSRTFLMGFYSGCHVAFGAALALCVGGSCQSLAQSNPGLQKFISGAFGLPLGVLMTTVTGGELFCINNAYLTSALVEKKASMKDLLKNWSFSYAGNFLGSLFIAWMAFNSGLLGDAAIATALSKTSLPFKTLFIRSVLANWLVCTAVYMASGCASLSSKAIAIWFPVSAVIGEILSILI